MQLWHLKKIPHSCTYIHTCTALIYSYSVLFVNEGGVVALRLVRSLWDLHHGIDQSRFEPWPGTLCSVLGQDTALTVPLSTHMYKQVLTWTSISSKGELATCLEYRLYLLVYIKHYLTIHKKTHLTWHNNCLDSGPCCWSWLVWRGWGTVCFRGEGRRLGWRHGFAVIQFGTSLITVPFLWRRLWLLISDWWTVLFVNERISCAFDRIDGVYWILRTIWTGFWSKNLGVKPQVTQYKNTVTVHILIHNKTNISLLKTQQG